MDRLFLEGVGVTIAAFVLFGGSVLLLLSAIFGLRMAYLVAATSTFGFMIILSAIWAFGAPGTPRFLGPQGTLPHWQPLAAGSTLESPAHPVIEEYPGGPWTPAGDDAELSDEEESAAGAFTGFLAERATEQLREADLEGEIPAGQFEVRDVRFTEVDGTLLAAARGFATTGGPEVIVVGLKDEGDEATPSFAFLIASILGFAIHLPFLDRAERRRKEILTGGEQSPWRGPA